MTHVHKLTLETFVWGLYIVQDAHNEAEFADAITELPEATAKEYTDHYAGLKRIKAACMTHNDNNPWVIVVFSSDPAMIRRHTLHEGDHLGHTLPPPPQETRAPLLKDLRLSEETRVRFIEPVYFALTDTPAP